MTAAWEGKAGAPGAAQPSSPPAEEPAPTPAVVRDMHAQLAIITRMRDAVVTGDRALALEQAGRLRAQVATIDAAEPWHGHLDALATEAEGLDPASPLPDVAAAVAHLAAGCGACHSAMRVDPPFPNDPQPEINGDLATSMQAHRWAVARMWEGLIGPSDDRWLTGTATFVALPGCRTLHGDNTEEVRGRCHEVSQLVRRGHVADSGPARTALYGRLLVTCAGCHGASHGP